MIADLHMTRVSFPIYKCKTAQTKTRKLTRTAKMCVGGFRKDVSGVQLVLDNCAYRQDSILVHQFNSFM